MNENDGTLASASPRQIAANQRNAGKSTGPKTAEGKGLARMNAVKHGILSAEVVVRGLRIQERLEEFKALRERFWESLAPVGPVEEMLVDRIVTVQWRLRRALVAEAGEIALSVDGGQWERSSRERLSLGVFFSDAHDAAFEMTKSADGVMYLRVVMEGVRDDVNRDGELSEAALQRVVRRFGGRPNHLTQELARLRERLTANPDGLAPEVLRENHQRAVGDYIEGKLRSYTELSRQRQEREGKEEVARQAADVMPAPEVLDKILRYETALERQLYRALNQLERLQRRREGEDVPPPLTVEVSRRI
jgi:hypothetical protein